MSIMPLFVLCCALTRTVSKDQTMFGKWTRNMWWTTSALRICGSIILRAYGLGVPVRLENGKFITQHYVPDDAKINTLEFEGKCSPSTESRPSVPVNLTWNWQGRKQSQIRERICWDSEYLSDGRIGKLCRYYRRQKDIKYKRVVKERIGKISWYTRRQNRLLDSRSCVYDKI